MRKRMRNTRRLIGLAAAVLMLSGWWFAAHAADTPPPTSVQEEKGMTTGPGEVQERAVPGMVEPPVSEAPIVRPPRTAVPPVGIAPSPSVPATGPGGPLPVVGGTNEPDYKYPWVVRLSSFSCGGVLLDPQWVLTAAHCVTPLIGFSKVTYSRTDPYTGAVQTETRGPAQNVGPSNNRGVFIHPDFNKPSPIDNDIALIKLAQPFTINPYIQTVALPRDSRHIGMVGTVASIRHDGTPVPPGQIAIFRGPISAIDSPTKIFVPASTAGASLCPGDSGSGFVTVESGRVTVRGTTSQATVTDCMTPSGEAVFTDVFAFRGWILQTMGKNDASLVGNTRVRWSGRAARGVMGVACFNPYGNLWGPLNVVGVEEGADCEHGQTQTVMCKLEKDQGNVSPVMVPTLSGLTMRTTMANGASEMRTLPASGTTASFFGLLPAGASRTFTCQLGTPFTAPLTGTNAAIMSRGIEGESAAEPTVEQPSDFDQPGNSTVNIQPESTPENPPTPSVEPQR